MQGLYIMFSTLRKPGERSRIPLGFYHFCFFFCLPKRQLGEAVEGTRSASACPVRERKNLGCWTIVLEQDKITTDLELACNKVGDQFPPGFTALGSCACIRRRPSWEIWCKRSNSVSTACSEHAGGCEALQLWDLGGHGGHVQRMCLQIKGCWILLFLPGAGFVYTEREIKALKKV